MQTERSFTRMWIPTGLWPCHSVWRHHWPVDRESSFQQECSWYWGSCELWDIRWWTDNVISGDRKWWNNCTVLQLEGSVLI